MTDTTAGEARPETLAETCLRMAESRAFDIQPSVRTVLRLAHDALAAQPSAGAQGEYRPAITEVVAEQLWHWFAVEHEIEWPPHSPGEWREKARSLIAVIDLATPAQPDTGDVAALRGQVTDLRNLLERGLREAVPDGMILAGHVDKGRAIEAAGTLQTWMREVKEALAALSKPNAPGREG